jgi:hypothetical protein
LHISISISGGSVGKNWKEKAPYLVTKMYIAGKKRLSLSNRKVQKLKARPLLFIVLNAYVELITSVLSCIRPVGKPRTRWEDVVRKDTSQILGIREWRRRANDREKWRRRLRDARAQKGL